MKKVDIITAHNIAIDYEAASVMSRGIAKFLDLLVIMIYTLIIFFVLLQILLQSIFGSSYVDESFYIMFVVFQLPVIFYTILSEYLFKGQTIGKMAMGIRVVKLNGENGNVNDYTMRWAFNLIDFWFSASTLR